MIMGVLENSESVIPAVGRLKVFGKGPLLQSTAFQARPMSGPHYYIYAIARRFATKMWFSWLLWYVMR